MFPEFTSFEQCEWNVSDLTLREHFICHRLLVKMTTGKASLSCAYGLKRLASIQSKYSSRQYEIAKLAYSQRRRLNPSPLKGKPGKPWSESDRKKHSEKLTKRMSDPLTRKKCSLPKLGKPGHPQTEEFKTKMSVIQRNLSPEQRARKSASKTGDKNPAFGKKWFNNGINIKQFIPGQEPIGWIMGKK